MGNLTQNWVDILIPFTSNYGKKLSGTELARLSNMPQQTASRTLRMLVKQNILDYAKHGRNKLYSFDHTKKNTKIIFHIAESSKSLILLQKIRHIAPMIHEIAACADSLIIFGSYSNFTFDSSSDIDILVLGSNKEKIKEIQQRKITEINVHYSSIPEFSRALKSKNPLSLEILSNHTLFGNISPWITLFLKATT